MESAPFYPGLLALRHTVRKALASGVREITIWDGDHADPAPHPGSASEDDDRPFAGQLPQYVYYIGSGRFVKLDTESAKREYLGAKSPVPS